MINKRNEQGTIKFDHEEKTLQLIAHTESLNANEKTATDVRNLSGGERFFLFIFFLLFFIFFIIFYFFYYYNFKFFLCFIYFKMFIF
jgi:hypothetical protein